MLFTEASDRGVEGLAFLPNGLVETLWRSDDHMGWNVVGEPRTINWESARFILRVLDTWGDAHLKWWNEFGSLSALFERLIGELTELQEAFLRDAGF